MIKEKQTEFLNTKNEEYPGQDKLFRMVCDTSHNAFLYYNFKKDEVITIGNWDAAFPYMVKSGEELFLLLKEVPEEERDSLKNALFPEYNGEERDFAECRLNNGRTWLSFESRVLYDKEKNPVDKMICIKDITRFKNQQEELEYLSYYDNQTALFNRNYFVKLLGDMVKKAEEEQVIVSVLIVDIDDFRKINDGLGMLVGDEVIQQCGQFLGIFSSDKCITCHMNSDIFCMAVYDPVGDRSVESIYHKIQERMAKGFVLSDGTDIHLTVSIGVAEYPEASQSVLELINCAEIVMFKAKSGGKSSIQYFDAPILQDFLQKASIENQLKEAIFNNNFCLYFQPQYYTNGEKLRGVEALIRWRNQENKMISPSVFIPIAEKNGAIIPIGGWVIEESIRQYAKWRAEYGVSMIMSINISAVQYKRKDFVNKLMEIIHMYGVNPKEIEIEITESILIDDFADVKGKLMQLREYGIRISLDDFGTGYSSLSYLNGLPIDTLKIDKSFVDRVMTDRSTRIIMESVITMVNKLGYETIAEGVEEEEQLNYMKEIGCHIIQGYYLGKPMPGDDLEKLLQEMAKREGK